MDDLIEDLSKRDFTDDDCIVVVIMSHGDEEGIMGTETKIYNRLKYKVIEEYFYKNQSLAGKPKLFFYSACQGGKIRANVKCWYAPFHQFLNELYLGTRLSETLQF